MENETHDFLTSQASEAVALFHKIYSGLALQRVGSEEQRLDIAKDLTVAIIKNIAIIAKDYAED